MVYKLGTPADMAGLSAVPAPVHHALLTELSILEREYGAERNIDTDDGGFMLYCTPGTTAEEVKPFFDPTDHILEWAARIASDPPYCSALYLLGNDYAVEIFMAVADTPAEVQAEMEELHRWPI